MINWLLATSSMRELNCQRRFNSWRTRRGSLISGSRTVASLSRQCLGATPIVSVARGDAYTPSPLLTSSGLLLSSSSQSAGWFEWEMRPLSSRRIIGTDWELECGLFNGNGSGRQSLSTTESC